MALSWICWRLPARHWKKPGSKLSPYSYLLPFPLGLWDLTLRQRKWNGLICPPDSLDPYGGISFPLSFSLCLAEKGISLKVFNPRFFTPFPWTIHTQAKILNKKSAQLAGSCSQPRCLLLTKLRKSRTFSVQPGKRRPSLSSWRKGGIMWRFKSDAAATFIPWSSQTRSWQSSWSSPRPVRQRRSWHEASLLGCQLYVHFKNKKIKQFGQLVFWGILFGKHSLISIQILLLWNWVWFGRPLLLSSKISWHKSCYLPINTIEK